MKFKYKILKTVIAGVALLSLDACTKLDENSYDTLRSDQFYSNRNEIISAVLRPYTHANAWATPSGQDGWWRPSELSADQLAWPTKGQHGEDGGKWKRLHGHSWTVDEGGLNQMWLLTYWGIGLCNVPIQNIEKQDAAAIGITADEKKAYIAELKLLRAYHYIKLMDLFGNIPVVTVSPEEPVSTDQYPTNSTRKEVFDFIEKEIKDNINDVPKLSEGMLGRMTQAGGYAMLVELYLNAEVWSGSERWDDCIAAADMLINNAAGGQNGAIALDPNILDQFKPNNNLSKETIFSIAYEFQRGNFAPSWTGEFYHFQQSRIYGGSRNGNNGVVVVPGNFTKYDDEDLRKSEWLLIGPQVDFQTGQPLIAEGGNEYEGEQLVFVDYIRRQSEGKTSSTMSDGEENSGPRFNKYRLGNQFAGFDGTAPNPNYNSTDWNLYRLTWIYFAKAEALMRKNGGAATGEAVTLINDCKRRAYSAADWQNGNHAYTVATLTLDELLEERGREFIFEGYRRDDMIRFGKFTTASWWDHSASSEYRNLFPIPLQQIILNPKLKQNPGY